MKQIPASSSDNTIGLMPLDACMVWDRRDSAKWPPAESPGMNIFDGKVKLRRCFRAFTAWIN